MRRLAIAIGLLVALAAGLLASGWTTVAPGEVVVVRRFGRILPRPWEAGPHWGWPLGIDCPTRVRTDEVRRLEVGLAGTPGAADDPGAGEFLTGDLNLLRARCVVQYRVADPVAFARLGPDPERLLARLAESSLTRALSRVGIDAALRDGRLALARDAEIDLSQAVDRHRLGLSILGVGLTDARPPREVQPDFDAAQAARSARDRRLIEARSAALVTLSAAAAESQGRRDRAQAQSSRVQALAHARADRFLALQAEAGRDRRETVRRLYLDALRDLLPRVRRKLILTPAEPVDLSILGVEP